MKTRNIIVGALCVLAVVAVPMANASISVGACTDAHQKDCKSFTVGTNAASCYERETPFNGSVIDPPSCQLNV